MSKTIFSTAELNVLRNVMEQQMDITQSFVEAAMDNNEVYVAVGHTKEYFQYKNISDMLSRLDFDFDADEYKSMIAPLEYFVEMLSDTQDDIDMLFDCAAMLAKVKVWLVFYSSKPVQPDL